MTQVTITEEGAFQYDVRTDINTNFTELYERSLVARQSADVVADESTTLTDLTGLVLTLAAGTYKVKISLQALSTANGGVKIALNYTAPTSIQLEVKAHTASAVAVTRFTTVTDQASIYAVTAVANICFDIEGTIVVATAGTVQVQGAQNASHTDTTSDYTGSSFEAIKIA